MRASKRYQTGKVLVDQERARVELLNVGDILGVLFVSVGFIVSVFMVAEHRFVIPSAIAISFVAFFGFVLRRGMIRVTHVSYDDLQPAQCQELLTMLQTLPDGEAYRQAVLDQGRLFTEQDFAVVEYAYDVQEQARHTQEQGISCKALYDVPA